MMFASAEHFGGSVNLRTCGLSLQVLILFPRTSLCGMLLSVRPVAGILKNYKKKLPVFVGRLIVNFVGGAVLNTVINQLSRRLESLSELKTKGDFSFFVTES